MFNQVNFVYRNTVGTGFSRHDEYEVFADGKLIGLLRHYDNYRSTRCSDVECVSSEAASLLEYFYLYGNKIVPSIINRYARNPRKDYETFVRLDNKWWKNYRKN